jgi:hypothetical protein
MSFVPAGCRFAVKKLAEGGDFVAVLPPRRRYKAKSFWRSWEIYVQQASRPVSMISPLERLF